MSSLVLTEVADAILRIQINRPDKKNALTVTMYGELAGARSRGEEAHGRGDSEADSRGGRAIRQATPFAGSGGGVQGIFREACH